MNHRLLAKASILALALAAPTAVLAQGAAEALRDEILVTATKQADAENVQDVPLAVTAYGDKQLDALKVRDLESLTYSVPNVSLDDIGTSPNVANFSIRGLGINSSIPSIDPTVGVFVDGVYLGINGGVVLDIFDLESIEVLRGPQGILFGRNTTGGAVLINTKRPSDEWEADFKGAIESGMRGTGMNYYAMGAIGGPLFGENLRAKIAVYYNNDRGWFENYLGGPVPNAVVDVALAGALGPATALLHGPGVDAFEDFGKAETLLIRPSIYWTPTDAFEVIVRYEHSSSETDGPAAQNHANGVGAPNIFFTAPRDSFDFSINEPGFTDGNTDSVTAEARLDLGESGVFTNIFGWRDFEATTRSDIDGTPLSLFHAGSTTDQDQMSEEIRYNNRFFDAIDTTLGFYYFTQDIAYNEIRNVLGPIRFFNGGGVQDQKTWAFFGQFDIDLSDRFTINLGARYTHEEKDVVISNLILNSNTPAVLNPSPACDVRIPGDCIEDFVSSDSWNNFTPKAGFEWRPVDFMNLYAHWTQGVRSGGYNFRNTSLASVPVLGGAPNPAFNPLFLPGPFDEEKVNAYEVGFKAQPGGGMATINAAFYVNDISDMQRELNLADPLTGVVQVILNTADATIWGFELESQIAFTDHFVFLGSLGYANGEYDSLLFDIGAPAVSPGVVDAADLALEIPRLAPWTYGVGFVHTIPLGGDTTVDTRFNYSHRDQSFYTDNNLGFLNEVDIIDASIALNFGSATLSVYGKNLTNEVNFGGDTQLPASLGGGTFSPLAKGRRVGIELQVGF
ncbi:MAG: TonB-dependent receptor [Parvularculaceae bacterium]|nr:TonB-dependent receptor [Parvularculaceae bacterium]